MHFPDEASWTTFPTTITAFPIGELNRHQTVYSSVPMDRVQYVYRLAGIVSFLRGKWLGERIQLEQQQAKQGKWKGPRKEYDGERTVRMLESHYRYLDKKSSSKDKEKAALQDELASKDRQLQNLQQQISQLQLDKTRLELDLQRNTNFREPRYFQQQQGRGGRGGRGRGGFGGRGGYQGWGVQQGWQDQPNGRPPKRSRSMGGTSTEQRSSPERWISNDNPSEHPAPPQQQQQQQPKSLVVSHSTGPSQLASASEPLEQPYREGNPRFRDRSPRRSDSNA